MGRLPRFVCKQKSRAERTSVLGLQLGTKSRILESDPVASGHYHKQTMVLKNSAFQKPVKTVEARRARMPYTQRLKFW